MAQPGYPQQGFGSPEQPSSQDPSPPPQQYDAQGQAPAGGKKRRQYAGQAYDFGAGANTQPPAGAAYSGVTAGYEGYNVPQQAGYQQPQQPQPQAQDGYQAAGYGSGYGNIQQQQQQYGQSQYQPQPAGAGGYQPPDGMYAGAGGDQGGMDHLATGLNNMGLQGSPQPAPQQAPMQRPHLNQLHPTDMMNQPFQVSELDLPPPPMVLPPNVSRSTIRAWETG